jgi:hypothetical protein
VALVLLQGAHLLHQEGLLVQDEASVTTISLALQFNVNRLPRIKFTTLEMRILAPACLLSQPKVLSCSSAPRIWPFTLM